MSEESKTIMEEQEETSENTMPPPLEKSIEIEKIEEQKLKSKFPAIGGRPLGGGGHSAFLQKRLGKGQKYFDSGDYQMAKQGGRLGRNAMPVLAQPTGEAHPTPDSVPARKSSIIQGVAGQGGPGQIGGQNVGQHVGQPLQNPAMARLL
eukprot:TRINITY_DN3860_c0_g1_i1.p1 TRINITY_DN3860_c0_g1~~TRINITY_DN3860_c0_g1_i1.p1  ORF type:complete len:149 (+),score=61.99 TRINITY_DN3860_c0_g1_i1:53-499(+)